MANLTFEPIGPLGYAGICRNKKHRVGMLVPPILGM